MGVGTGHNMRNWWTGDVYDLHDDIAPAKAKAFGQAGITVDEAYARMAATQTSRSSAVGAR